MRLSGETRGDDDPDDLRGQPGDRGGGDQPEADRERDDGSEGTEDGIGLRAAPTVVRQRDPVEHLRRTDR